MANADQLKMLRQSVDVWNAGRKLCSRPDLDRADLSGANLRGADLNRANLRRANLRKADLREADLSRANLKEADLCEADLSNADLTQADLNGADLTGTLVLRANLRGAYLYDAILTEALLAGTNLNSANLRRALALGVNLDHANLSYTDLNGAHLADANLRGADLSNADLSNADLSYARLVDADIKNADLTGCRVYGVSAWDLKIGENTKQSNLIITGQSDPTVTVDNIEIAQFVYLLLNNEKIRDVIDTIGKKAVLILGRFTAERKAVLDAIRDELRRLGYLPILFDFDKPASRDLTATVSTLAHLSRFIIADLTDPSSIPHELATVVPTTPVPVQPIILSGKREFGMFSDHLRRYNWVLDTHHYDSQVQLIADLSARVIRPAEDKVMELLRQGR